MAYQVKQWRYYPVVKAIQAMRGVRLLVATGVIAELGDLTRFDHPRKLMAYLGLVPSEHTTGSHRKLGGLTKTGNSRARRLLIEGAHNYRYAANIIILLPLLLLEKWWRICGPLQEKWCYQPLMQDRDWLAYLVPNLIHNRFELMQRIKSRWRSNTRRR